jgi:uncharacterized protein YyaL (SSP411 family)
MAPHLNHLANQTSPYLLQHAENPVDWYPWAPEVLQKAQSEQKPIMLSVGYSTCHWCHVMAHESFENEDIAKIINEHFIAIKVDREERPDIDQIYMTAVTAMTGQGGWPLTAFLTPEGKPFYGGTYFPPVAKWGSPAFGDLLNTIAQAWKNQQEQILSSSEEITKVLKEQTQRFTQSSIPEISLLKQAAKQISAQFDSQNGGFGTSPKFPMGHYLSFLLRFYKRTKDQHYLEMVEKTLAALGSGGIYDHLGGGFHRYSTDPHWHVPHFEKMLYDQALLVKAYVECYQITGNLKYAMIAHETLNYVLNDMRHPQGGFYCAEDADSLVELTGHKAEGAFYVWSKQEIIDILGEANASIFNYAFGTEDQGNAKYDPHGEFIGKNILFLAHEIQNVSTHFKIEEKEAEEILERSKRELFEHRRKRPRPHLDDKILTDWNGLMLGALAFAGAVFNESKYIEAAKKSADFILLHLKSNGRLLHSWRQGKSQILGTLEDYAFFINGLLDLYETSFEDKYLKEAKELAEQMIVLFEDKEQGGFFLTGHDAPALIVRPKEIYDGAIPSGNSLAAYLLNRLYLMSSEERWLYSLESILKTFSKAIEQSPSAYTYALCAFDFYSGPALNLVLEGPPKDTVIAEMKKIVYKHFIPNKVVIFKSTDSSAQAHVCQGKACQKPVQQIQLFEDQLLKS